MLVNNEFDEAAETKNPPEDFTVENFYNAVRYGIKSQVQKILESKKEFVHQFDDKGFSSVHWAAKRGDVEMLETLHMFGASLCLPTVSDAKMYPIHWAASDGRITALNFFIEKFQDINVQDANGCTPIAVAAQHNHINSVIYLSRHGADLLICDNNGDNPLHWASYKGHIELVGYLSYIMKDSIENFDNYGQTALHLASLRGNYEVVEYLVSNCHADINKKDRNGQLPLDLSITKEKFKVELFLRKVSTSSIFSYLMSILFRKPINNKIICMSIFGSNDKEISFWPWRVVFISNFIGSLFTLYFLGNENLSDLYLLHMLNFTMQLLWWFCFLKCLFISPGKVIDENEEYSKCIDIISNSSGDKSLPLVCHSCRVRRPIRSKHCKIQRHCIQKFDHFCPFVGNTVGRDNYKYFFGLLVMHMICGSLWQITAIYLVRRIWVNISYMFLFYIFYALVWMFMIFGLLNYHIQLIVMNMTTNEHINHMKYPYMVNAFGSVESPFMKGSVLENLYDGLFPSKKNYFSRAEVKADQVAIKV